MVKWAYHTCILNADANEQREYLKKRWPEDYFEKHAPQSLIPKLDRIGEEGWELVSMDPVAVGQNQDIKTHALGQTGRDTWVSSYLCVFKRPREG